MVGNIYCLGIFSNTKLQLKYLMPFSDINYIYVQLYYKLLNVNTLVFKYQLTKVTMHSMQVDFTLQ